MPAGSLLSYSTFCPQRFSMPSPFLPEPSEEEQAFVFPFCVQQNVVRKGTENMVSSREWAEVSHSPAPIWIVACGAEKHPHPWSETENPRDLVPRWSRDVAGFPTAPGSPCVLLGPSAPCCILGGFCALLCSSGWGWAWTLGLVQVVLNKPRAEPRGLRLGFAQGVAGGKISYTVFWKYSLTSAEG